MKNITLEQANLRSPNPMNEEFYTSEVEVSQLIIDNTPSCSDSSERAEVKAGNLNSYTELLRASKEELSNVSK